MCDVQVAGLVERHAIRPGWAIENGEDGAWPNGAVTAQVVAQDAVRPRLGEKHRRLVGRNGNAVRECEASVDLFESPIREGPVEPADRVLKGRPPRVGEVERPIIAKHKVVGAVQGRAGVLRVPRRDCTVRWRDTQNAVPLVALVGDVERAVGVECEACRDPPGVEYLGDLRDINRLEYFVQETAPEILFHLAAYKERTSAIDSFADAIAINIMGSLNLLSIASRQSHLQSDGYGNAGR